MIMINLTQAKNQKKKFREIGLQSSSSFTHSFIHSSANCVVCLHRQRSFSSSTGMHLVVDI